MTTKRLKVSMTPIAQTALGNKLLRRLDRIPLTKSVIFILVLLSLVSLAEAFDIGIVGPVLSMLTHLWSLSAAQTGLLGSASTLGVVLGLLPAGYLADRYGRRKVILVGILSFSLITLMGTFASGFDSVLAVRFLAGIGEGAVLPMPYLYLSEFLNRRRRAVGVGYANGFLTAAYLLPNLPAVFALKAFPDSISWRIPFLLGGVPLILLIPLLLWLPESPRFLVHQGQTQKLEQLVGRLEDEAGLLHELLKGIDAGLNVFFGRGNAGRFGHLGAGAGHVAYASGRGMSRSAEAAPCR